MPFFILSKQSEEPVLATSVFPLNFDPLVSCLLTKGRAFRMKLGRASFPNSRFLNLERHKLNDVAFRIKIFDAFNLLKYEMFIAFRLIFSLVYFVYFPFLFFKYIKKYCNTIACTIEGFLVRECCPKADSPGCFGIKNKIHVDLNFNLELGWALPVGYTCTKVNNRLSQQ